MKSEQEEFMCAEIEKMREALWIESEKAHKNLAEGDDGCQFFMEWVAKHGKPTREAWNRSKCRTCLTGGCKKRMVEACDNYVPRPSEVVSEKSLNKEDNMNGKT
jgi:hypothetical protein